MNEVDYYHPTNAPAELGSLTAMDLFSLRNAVIRYGVRSVEGPVDGPVEVARLWSPNPEIGVMVSPLPGMRNIVVMGPIAGNPGSHPIRLQNSNGEPTALVVWDKRITLAQVQTFTQNAEQLRPLTEEKYRDGEGKMRVADYFDQPGKAMPCFTGMPPAEDLIQKFDHPELLSIVEYFRGFKCIILAEELPNFASRKMAVEKVLRRAGINPLMPLSLATLPSEVVMQLRDEISRVQEAQRQ